MANAKLGRIVRLTRKQAEGLAGKTDKVADVFVEHAIFRNASGSIPQQYFTPEQIRRAERAQLDSGRKPGVFYY